MRRYRYLYHTEKKISAEKNLAIFSPSLASSFIFILCLLAKLVNFGAEYDEEKVGTIFWHQTFLVVQIPQWLKNGFKKIS